MPPPSQLVVATSALTRLIKEEKSYHDELKQQQKRVAKLEEDGVTGDENAEFTLRQERQAIKETEKLFPQLRTQIEAAQAFLETQLQDEDKAPAEEVSKAKEALASATTSLGDNA